MKIITELTRDGNVSVPNLSKKLGINTAVLYSRIKRLIKKKLIKKLTIIVDASLIGIGVRATMGINRAPKRKDQIQKALMKPPEVTEISAVTGRFDILLTVRLKNLQELH